MPAPHYVLKLILRKYFPQRPSEEWVLPSLEELIKMVKNLISVPEYTYTNAPRWQRDDKEGFEKALREICRRVLELRFEEREENDISVTVARTERKWGDDVMGRWELTDVAIALTRPPPKPRGRPKARKKYPVEEWRKMQEKGLSIREIAERTGVPKSTIHRLLSRPENK